MRHFIFKITRLGTPGRVIFAVFVHMDEGYQSDLRDNLYLYYRNEIALLKWE